MSLLLLRLLLLRAGMFLAGQCQGRACLFPADAQRRMRIRMRSAGGIVQQVRRFYNLCVFVDYRLLRSVFARLLARSMVVFRQIFLADEERLQRMEEPIG